MTAAKLKVKRDDTVIVLAGKDKGRTGKITKVLVKDNKVLVEGVNKVKRHTRPSPTSQGGIIEKEMPIHASNVALVDPKTQKPTRVGYKMVDGKKLRFAKKSGEVIEG